jgi:hypothetical protein
MPYENIRQRWFENLLRSKGISPTGSITVEGRIDKHVGPQMVFAEIKVAIGVSQEFSVFNEVEMTDDLIAEKFPEYVIFGILDVLMTSDLVCTDRLQLTIKGVKTSPIDTSPLVFREAGRDAARNFLLALKNLH